MNGVRQVPASKGPPSLISIGAPAGVDMDHAECREHPETAEKPGSADVAADKQMRAGPKREGGQHRMADDCVDAFAGRYLMVQRIHADQGRVPDRDAAQKKENREIHHNQNDGRSEQPDIPDPLIRGCVIGANHPDERRDHQDRINSPERSFADHTGNGTAYRSR